MENPWDKRWLTQVGSSGEAGTLTLTGSWNQRLHNVRATLARNLDFGASGT
jgi:hypothetical protein